MISQKCPKCYSKRVRRGYRRTPIFMKIFFRYHLLCDGCNWEFSGFAVPGTVTSKPVRKKNEPAYEAAPVDTEAHPVEGSPKEKSKKKVKVRY